jgi:hypothetical protein
MMEVVKYALFEERKLQEILGIPQGIIIDVNTNFVFLNR